MANYSTLKTAVADVVKTNGNQAITGANLQSVLLSIINSVGGGGYIFAGVATPSTNAGTPDQNVFYIGGAGTYANFGTSVVVPLTNIAVFKYDGTWTCEQIMVDNGGVFDISAFNAVGGTLATYSDLATALGTNSANVPEEARKGGISIKFVQSSDNKYVQYRLMDDEWSIDTEDWAIYSESVYVENPEYIQVITDSNKKVLQGFKKDTGAQYLSLPSNQDDILQGQINEINDTLNANDVENKVIINLSFISKATSYDEVVDFIKPGEYGLWYGNAGQRLIHKTINGGIDAINDTATLCSYKYNYAGTIFSIFQAQGYVMPQLCEDVKKPSHDVLPDCKIPMLDTMPDYTGETWDWTKAVREWSRGAAVYSIMQQSYAYLDALVLAYPNLITKYDPMASADYTEGGITVHAMSNIKTYMANHGFNNYPFWYDGCDEGDYTVGEYTAHIKACPRFRAFVYKISHADNWYMYKQDNRRVRRRNLYVQAGVHGYENMGPVAACHLAKELVSTSDSAFSVLAHFDVYILPCLDGYNILHGDYDGALGVNANRNYPTPWWREEDEHWGKAAGDYFVTRLACAFIDTLNPDVAFDVHDQTPAVRDFGYFECGYHYTTHQMYHAYPCIASVVRNTSDFIQYFGTKNQIPLMRNQNFPTNAAHAHDYFFAKGIRCGGVLELPSGINYTEQADGTSIYVRTTANDFNQDTWELAGLLMIDYVYKMCEYNINNF